MSIFQLTGFYMRATLALNGLNSLDIRRGIWKRPLSGFFVPLRVRYINFCEISKSPAAKERGGKIKDCLQISLLILSEFNRID